MTMMSTRTYSPKEVFVLVGVLPILTFNSVNIAYKRPRWTFFEGTRGEFTRTKSLTVFGTITVTLPRTSNFNDLMYAQYISYGVMSVLIKDLHGMSTHFMLKGTIVNVPDVNYEADVNDSVWIIQGKINLNVIGGSIHMVGNSPASLN